ncbi:MAG: hypothetical protein QM715_01095 [Nibricoccus sp.]
MKRSASFVFLVLALAFPFCSGLRAAIEKDLGQALLFLRVTDASADQSLLIDTIERRAALVLDLRGLNGDAAFVRALHSALAKPPLPHAVRMVLINAATAPAIVATLEDDALLSVITLGPRSAKVIADIQITITAEEERRALEALSNDTPLEKLINYSREKRRYDEAKLVHDHVNGIAPSDDELPLDAEDDTVAPDSPTKKKSGDTAKKADQPPHDLVLERAVQLHRSLLALKKL